MGVTFTAGSRRQALGELSVQSPRGAKCVIFFLATTFCIIRSVFEMQCFNYTGKCCPREGAFSQALQELLGKLPFLGQHCSTVPVPVTHPGVLSKQEPGPKEGPLGKRKKP